MLKRFLAVTITAMLATQVQARGFDLRLADETAEILYLTESSTFGYGGADVGVGFFFNEADDVSFSASAMISGHGAGNNRALKFGVGFKGLFTSIDVLDEEVGALAIGGQVRYVFPSATPVAFLLEGFIAPSIVSFSGADQYTEFRAAIELEVTPSARAYVGYRNMQYELENYSPDYELDDDWHVGVRVEF